jgi:D-arginine dehydrogenase
VTDFVVIGGGMAGVSAAAHLAPHGSVTLLEMEATLAYHTTGRSAALFIVNYGGEGSRPLARASESFLEDPPEESADTPLLADRGALWVGDADHVDLLEKIAEEGERSGAGSEVISAWEVIELVPAMRREWVAGGIYEPSARDIDVAGLHQAFVRIARRHGAEIRTSAPVTSITRSNSGWIVEAGGERIECGAVINAAGAWGDPVAEMAGVEPIGLQPMRRTAFMVPGDEAYSEWPMVVDVDHRFYFRPDGVQLLCSLAEEELSEPTDPRPRMEDVALAIERINGATTLGIRTVNSEWCGLRTFAPDRDLVIGEDPSAPGFFWLVGQGGTGIMTAPAYGALLASQVIGSDLPPGFAEAGVDPATTHPARFR